MATFLDVTGLQHFSNIFAFIFVWLIVYAILSYTKALGGNNLINILIGFILGLFTLFSPTVTGAIISMAPWFAIIFVFFILITVASNMFGATDMGNTPVLKGLLMTLVIGILVVGFLIYVRDSADVPDEIDEDSDLSKATNVIFHPKMIAIVFIMVVAIFTIGLLASKPV